MMISIEELAKKLGLGRVKIRGEEIHASCPFPEKHITGKDSHPSFSLNIDKGVYNCFSCGSRGTIEELVSKIKKISIPEAISILQEWGFGKLERELREKHEDVRPEILPDGFLLYFDKVEDDFAEIYRGEVDGQDCLIYPVRRKDGKLVGAIARSTTERWHKVMWNMTKKLYLYGEDRIVIEEPIVIVEGPGDVIALRKSGINNTVALMGINISDEQVEKFLSLSSDFVVWLDKDNSGAKGMQLIHKKMENRANIRYVDPFKDFPKDCKDPKDVFEKNGPIAVANIIYSAKTFIEHVVEDNCFNKTQIEH